MIKLFVWPEIAMANTEIDFKDNLVISITSPGSEHVRIKGNNVYKFHFHDVREPIELMDGSTMMPMSEEIAESIVDIALNNRHCKVWVINCEAGISRSPGVAIGLGRFIDTKPSCEELMRDFPCYNKHVSRLIEIEMRKRLKEMKLSLLEE
jgi:predicted protein tyrosine phosphatase